MAFWQRWIKSPGRLGVDITADEIRMVCLAGKDRSYRLLAHGFFKRDNAQAIVDAFSEPLFKHAEIRVGLQDAKSKIRILNFPKVPPSELKELIEWGAKDAFKINLDDFVIRYEKIEEESDDKNDAFMVFAVEKIRIDQRLEELKAVGVPFPQVLTSHIQALCYLTLCQISSESKERVALVDIGERLIQFAVVSFEGVLFYRPFSSVDGSVFLSKTGEDVPHDFSKLLDETQYAIESYLALTRKKELAQVFLCAPTTKQAELKDQFSQVLKIPTRNLEVFKKVDLSQFSSLDVDELDSRYATAVGLALLP